MNLTGPEFLVAYALLCGVTLLLNRAARNRRESIGPNGSHSPPPLNDPYLVAGLRGGKAEVARLAIVNLTRSELLTANDGAFHATSRGLPAHILETAERLVLEEGRKGTTKALEVVRRVERLPEMNRYDEELRKRGLIPTAAQRSQRFSSLAVALVLLWTVAGLRFVQALSHGRHNVGFLVVMCIATGLFLASQTFKRRTTLGDRALSGLQQLFSKSVKPRADLQPNEAAMVAAVWGMGALLAHNDYLFVSGLFPKATDSSASGCGSSCGSSCSSGCGGGGCGGCGGGD